MTKEIVKEASEPKFKLITGVVKRAQKFIVYGKPAVGKSCFATQFPNPIMIQRRTVVVLLTFRDCQYAIPLRICLSSLTRFLMVLTESMTPL